MKIGMMTFHASHNCGSMLQAFALQHTLILCLFRNRSTNGRISELEKFGKYREFYYVDGILLDKRRAIECIRRKYYAYEFDFKLCIKFNPKDVVWFCREKRNVSR